MHRFALFSLTVATFATGSVQTANPHKPFQVLANALKSNVEDVQDIVQFDAYKSESHRNGFRADIACWEEGFEQRFQEIAEIAGVLGMAEGMKAEFIQPMVEAANTLASYCDTDRNFEEFTPEAMLQQVKAIKSGVTEYQTILSFLSK